MIRASSIHRYRNCSGAPAAEAECPETEEKTWTGDGRVVHDLIKGVKVEDADDALLEAADILAQSGAYVVDKILPLETEGIERGGLVQERDEPFYVIYRGNKIISGHPDYIQYGLIYDKRVAVVLDWKSGFLNVPAPECNDQLRSYAVAIWQEWEEIAFKSGRPELALDEVYASIIPRFGRATPVRYTRADLVLALEDLAEIDRAVRDANAVRIPSVEACRYCRARATSYCPETLYPPEKTIAMPSLIKLTPQEKGELLTLCKIVSGNIKALNERLYGELEADPDAVSGWHLAPGNIAKNIEDVAACYTQVQEFLEPAEYQRCLKVGKTKLVAALKDELGARENIKGKTASKRVDDILAPVIVAKQGEPRLEPKL
jgi:hypothetical protein